MGRLKRSQSPKTSEKRHQTNLQTTLGSDASVNPNRRQKGSIVPADVEGTVSWQRGASSEGRNKNIVRVAREECSARASGVEERGLLVTIDEYIAPLSR